MYVLPAAAPPRPVRRPRSRLAHGCAATGTADDVPGVGLALAAPPPPEPWPPAGCVLVWPDGAAPLPGCEEACCGADPHAVASIATDSTAAAANARQAPRARPVTRKD